MGNILLISENEQLNNTCKSISKEKGLSFDCRSTKTSICDMLEVDRPSIIIIDDEIQNIGIETIVKDLKTTNPNSQIILLTSKNQIENNILKYINNIIPQEYFDKLISCTVDICLKNKINIDTITDKNKNLSNSLYRLNVLYNTSSQFSGTLNQEKLIDYSIEGLDRALSFDITAIISFNTNNEPILTIYSLYDLSEELIQELKTRSINNYNSLNNKKITLTLNNENLKTRKIIKNTSKKYDFSILQYNNMFSSIENNERFFGCIEVLRNNAFTNEDTTYFQTILQQVSSALNSAYLYNEILAKNEKLEKLEHIKSEFISIVSHELRTPLTPIKNALSILKSGRCGELNENANKFLDMANRNVQTLTGIINDILDINKIEAGKMNFNYNLMNINSVIENVSNNFGSVAKEHDIIFTTEIQENLPTIFADGQRLEQVLTNLVSNAIKFTPNGKRITISTKIQNADDIKTLSCFEEDIKDLRGEYIIVSVTDEGIGISKQHIKNAFDKFTQIESSLLRKVGGTGLGLPIAKQLVKAHKGAIWCESEEGKGSTFNVAIPVSLQHQEELSVQKELI